MKYLILTGGVCSSLGKGFAASALGALLQALGFCVTIIKIDPYINEDAGLLRPREHGEVFVLQDGGETDLDLGHYERALGKNLGSQNIWTTGKIYRRLLDKERSGFFFGEDCPAGAPFYRRGRGLYPTAHAPRKKMFSHSWRSEAPWGIWKVCRFSRLYDVYANSSTSQRYDFFSSQLCT